MEKKIFFTIVEYTENSICHLNLYCIRDRKNIIITKVRLYFTYNMLIKVIQMYFYIISLVFFYHHYDDVIFIQDIFCTTVVYFLFYFIYFFLSNRLADTTLHAVFGRKRAILVMIQDFFRG